MSAFPSLKFGANLKEMKWLKKESKLIDHKRHKNVRIENLKQYTLKIEKCTSKQLKNKTGVNICDGTVRNQLNENQH